MATFQIPSATDETKSYTVTLGPRTASCQCPDHVYRERDCRHIRQARAEQFAKYALIAGSLEDAELARLIAKYRGEKGSILTALLAEEWDREQLARMPAPLPVFPTLDRVLVRARAWGQQRQPVGKQSGMTEDQRRRMFA